MESFQYSPRFSEEKTKQRSLSFCDLFSSRMNKRKHRGKNVPESEFRNWFNFSFIMASSLFLAGGILACGLAIGTMMCDWKIPKIMYPDQNVFIATPCLALAVAILSPLITWLSCLTYREEMNQKAQILLPSALGFVSIILMLIGAILCFHFRASVSEIVDIQGKSTGLNRTSYPPWHQDFSRKMSYLLESALPGSKELEEWNAIQTLMSCCGVRGHRDWLQLEIKHIPRSCCIDYIKALKIARIHSKTEEVICCEKHTLGCESGECKTTIPFMVLFNAPKCPSGSSFTPMGCLEKIELTLRDEASMSGGIFLVCVAVYVIAEIIMGTFFFEYSRPEQR